ncbi:YdcH family protein [Acuticoccus sp.]|uniref:YdcH family protein n=1 Tax=Acuticoccus sp. TaxID=1904378 RepID=UPI003B520599
MDEDQSELMDRLAALREQHRDLDAAVEALEAAGSTDLLQIKRLKKRKLQLKDEIRVLAAQVLPDIIA